MLVDAVIEAVKEAGAYALERRDNIGKVRFKSSKDFVTEKPQHYPDYGDELYYAVFFNDPDGLRLELFFEVN